MKSVIVGTAGHIDHGKTALIKSLTGIDADRLAEEKRRGITIDLGFAHLELAAPSGEHIRFGFVDVPGHERFVRNMLAGVGGTAVRTDFAAALTRTLWFQVGAFGASFALMLALPAGVGRRRPEEAADVIGAGAASNVSAARGAVTG